MQTGRQLQTVSFATINSFSRYVLCGLFEAVEVPRRSRGPHSCTRISASCNVRESDGRNQYFLLELLYAFCKS